MPMSPTPSAIRPTISSVSRSSRSTLTFGWAARNELSASGQELGQRIGVGQHPDLAGEPAGIGAEVLAQPLGLRQHGAGVLQQGAAGLGRRDAMPRPHQQRRAQRLLHVADAGAGRGQRQMGALGAVGDAAGLRPRGGTG